MEAGRGTAWRGFCSIETKRIPYEGKQCIGWAGPTTETYELIGLEDELRAHVGKQVTVYGQGDETRVAELRGLDPPAGATGTAGRQSGSPQAQVDTESRTRVEMRRLRILSVTPAGGLCAA